MVRRYDPTDTGASLSSKPTKKRGRKHRPGSRAAVVETHAPKGVYLWAFSLEQMATLFGCSSDSVRRLIRRQGFDPMDLQSICERWLITSGRVKRTRPPRAQGRSTAGRFVPKPPPGENSDPIDEVAFAARAMARGFMPGNLESLALAARVPPTDPPPPVRRPV